MVSNSKMREATAERVRFWSERVENAEVMLMAARAADRRMEASEAELKLKTAHRMLTRAQRLHFQAVQGNLFGNGIR